MLRPPMTERRRPVKKDVMLELLAKSGVFVYLDPRREGVVVPAGFKKQPELMLQLGLNMAVPIRDLEVDDEGISCTLSFNRSPFWCRMPWHAVFALVSDEDRRGAVWAEDAPRESKMAQGPAIEPPRPKLRAVGPDERAPEPKPEVARETVEGDGKCGDCGTKWLEDQDSCPLCGASREEAFRGTGEPTREGDAERDGDGAGEDEDGTRPTDGAPKIPLALQAFRESYDDVEHADAAEPAPRAEPEIAAPADGATDATPKPDEEDAGDEPKQKPKRPLPPWLRVVK